MTDPNTGTAVNTGTTDLTTQPATLASELFAPGVGAQAGPPTTPASDTGTAGDVTPGAHSHGGPAPTGSPAERFTSTDPDAFGVPTGREETWRFTPMKRIRPLLDGAPSSAHLSPHPEDRIIETWGLVPRRSTAPVRLTLLSCCCLGDEVRPAPAARRPE